MGIFLIATASRPALEPTRPSVRFVPGALTLEVNWSGRGVDSPTSSAEVKNAWSYTTTHLWCGA
jgi:hypothetical protein